MGFHLTDNQREYLLQYNQLFPGNGKKHHSQVKVKKISCVRVDDIIYLIPSMIASIVR